VGLLARGDREAARAEGDRLIYLIRHGETALNASRVLQHPETPLSERGLEQARRLAERLRGAGIAHILASDYARAARTAAALATATGAPLAHEPLLRERNFGDLRGRAYADLGLDPFAEGFAPPGGESWEAFHARVARAWARVEAEAARCGGALAVVTHGLVCRSVLLHHAPAAPGVVPADGARWRNASVTLIEGPPWHAVRVDDASHLEDEIAATEAGAA
jgi:probable phosphoglycerate mutase